MYEFEGFGMRMHELRKKNGLTQEELAGRVGVTGQAVSKWENGQAYPDITLIPTLATILGTEIDHLFGKKPTSPTPSTDSTFPSTHMGMPIVHSTQYVACYSNKDVEKIDKTGVKFTDGSTAELSNRMAVNTGQGDIQFIGDSDNPMQWFEDEINPTETNKEGEFGYVQNIDVTILNYDCEIKLSNDDKTRVKATGDPVFIKLLEFSVHGDSLTVNQKQINNYNNRGHKNLVVIELPCEKGNQAEIKTNGSGSVKSEIPFFHTGRVSINGSGAINVMSFETCSISINGSGSVMGIDVEELKLVVNGSSSIDLEKAGVAKVVINGSGDITIKEAASLNTSINGSGDMEIGEMTGGGELTAKIAGSGDIQIGKGNVEKFDADIHGSGDINAEGLTTKDATIVLHQDGTVVIGRVLERSTEQIKKKGRITVLNRGAE